MRLPGSKPLGLLGVQALALEHLGASEGLKLTHSEATRLVKRGSNQPAALIWAYVWELGRRAKGKGKGPVVHRVWREVPTDIRKALGLDVVWAAHCKLLNAARAFLGEATAAS